MITPTDAPPASLPPREPSAPSLALPEGTWDTHFHVLGPQHLYPYSSDRKYTPPDAPVEESMRLHARLGIKRGLAVHMNFHAFDNRVDLDAVARSGGRYLAVVRLDASATPSACQALHEAGARGVRFAFNPAHGGTLDLAVFDHVLRCIEGLGWFVELHFGGEDIPRLYHWIRQIPATVVIDHFGNIDVTKGTGDQGFSMISELAAKPNVWIKITCADRLSKIGFPYYDVEPFARALSLVAPSRLLWGTDWPHVGVFDPDSMPDDGKLVEALKTLLPDEPLRRQVLVDNPLRLLGIA